MKRKIIMILFIILIPNLVYARENDVKLYDFIYNKAVSEKIASEFVTADTGIDFAEANSLTNGFGVYKTNDEIAYYRGAVKNNYLTFGGVCYRIVRTTDTGGVKLLYAGNLTDDGCTAEGKDTVVTGVAYIDNAIDKTHYKYADSIAKLIVDGWYKSNILDKYDDYLEDTVYCNDVSANGYVSTNMVFNLRILGRAEPTFNCYEKDDRYTVSDKIGNGWLQYPAGLLTADEVMYAGNGKHNYTPTGGNVNYICTNQPDKITETYFATSYWLMTYDKWKDKQIAISQNCRYEQMDTDDNYLRGIRPVISLNNNVYYAGGDGTSTNPYTVSLYEELTDENTEIIIDNDSFTYTGEGIEPNVVVKYNDEELIKDIDYTVSYSNNINVSDAAMVIINGDGHYRGMVSKSFKITKSTYEVSTTNYDGMYDFNPHTIEINVLNTDEYTIKYGLNDGMYDLDAIPTFTDEGFYKIYYEISNQNYETYTGYGTINITELLIYNVTFINNGSETIKHVVINKQVSELAVNEIDGYTFLGWYTDSDNKFDFNTPIVEDITLYAKYNADQYEFLGKQNDRYYNKIDLKLKLNGPYTLIDELYVDNIKLNENNYQALEDGTIVINKNYLEELSYGSHNVSVKYKNSCVVDIAIVLEDIFKGDFNKNDKIDLYDVIQLLKIYLGVVEPTDLDTRIGDMNNSNIIELNDIILLLKIYLGIE